MLYVFCVSQVKGLEEAESNLRSLQNSSRSKRMNFKEDCSEQIALLTTIVIWTQRGLILLLNSQWGFLF